MSALRTALRAAAVQLLEDYKADADIRLQIYPGRPRSINPPTAFVDSIRESRSFVGLALTQRTPRVAVVVLHGLFDSKETAAQGDAFVDGFLEWVDERYHAASADSVIGITETEDDPTYTPDWLPEAEQRSYYATVFTLEGFGN